MRTVGIGLLAVASFLAGCSQPEKKPDVMAACAADVKKGLLNPETAEFHDLTEVDAASFKAVVIPVLEAENNFPAGRIMVDGERQSIESAAHLYTMRVRAEGKLGNKITKTAYCRQQVDGVEACFCKLID
jgi:hypothetical protein